MLGGHRPHAHFSRFRARDRKRQRRTRFDHGNRLFHSCQGSDGGNECGRAGREAHLVRPTAGVPGSDADANGHRGERHGERVQGSCGAGEFRRRPRPSPLSSRPPRRPSPQSSKPRPPPSPQSSKPPPRAPSPQSSKQRLAPSRRSSPPSSTGHRGRRPSRDVGRQARHDGCRASDQTGHNGRRPGRHERHLATIRHPPGGAGVRDASPDRCDRSADAHGGEEFDRAAGTRTADARATDHGSVRGIYGACDVDSISSTPSHGSPPALRDRAMKGSTWAPLARAQATDVTSAFPASPSAARRTLMGGNRVPSSGGTAQAQAATGPPPGTPQSASGPGSGAGGTGIANTFFGAFGALLLLAIPRLFRRVSAAREAGVPPPLVLLLDHPG